MAALPPRITRLSDEKEADYLERIRRTFTRDLRDATLFGRVVRRQATPMENGLPQTLWHLVSTSNTWTRSLDEARCEPVSWIRPMIDLVGTPSVKCWSDVRKDGPGLLIALPDFSYVVVLAPRPGNEENDPYFMLKTAYPPEKYRARKMQRDYARSGEYVP